MYANLLRVVAGVALVRGPSMAAVQGSTVTLECSSNISTAKLYWFNILCINNYCTTGSVYYNGTFVVSPSPRVSVTEVNNATHVTRNLNIGSTQLSDAGIYVCWEAVIPGIGDSTVALIVVLGKCRIVYCLKESSNQLYNYYKIQN